MRGVTFEAQIRGVVRQTGCEIIIKKSGGKRVLVAADPELSRVFLSGIKSPSDEERALKYLHSKIYNARGKHKFIEQDGKCALCGRTMTAYETDHKESRGAHGRDDRLSNLRAVHSSCHRQRHGG